MEKIKQFLKKINKKQGTISYAQYGEDLIVEGIFKTIHLPNPSYIDIGAHHPSNLSNTFFFYKKGGSGVCIEPSPILYKEIKKQRPRDICLNIGISDSSGEKIPYYVMTAQTMNTFSKEDAEKTISAEDVYGKQKIESIELISLMSIEEVFDKYFKDYGDFVSIDTEGMDEKIVTSINLNKYRPKVFCIETIEQREDGSFEKNDAIAQYMLNNNYFIYGDTYVNTIFVDKNIWTL